MWTLSRIAMAIAFAMAVATCIIVGFSMVTVGQVGDLGDSWAAFEEGPARKSNYLGQLQGAIGYGGMIHHLKNYVLRADKHKIIAAQASIREATVALTAYRALGVNDVEGRNIGALERIIIAYADSLGTAESLLAAGVSPQEIDRRIRIDDGPAMAALAALRTYLAAEREKSSATVYRVVQEVSRTTQMVAVVVGAILAVLVGVAVWFGRYRLGRPLTAMTRAMQSLAAGEHAVTVPALDRRDEIGAMAAALQVFKENALEKERRDEADRRRAEKERHAEEMQRQRETAIGEEIASLVGAIAAGDLTRRLDLAGKEGFYRGMSEGINRLADTVAGVVADVGTVLAALAEGDLRQTMSRQYEGAFEEIQLNLNTAVAKLSGVMSMIRQSADAIASASEEISNGSGDLAERTEQQAASLEQTAASMEELDGTVRSSAEHAGRANQMAAEARHAAEQGGAITAAAIEAMRRIDEASRRITDIIGVIDEIAFQTNLLALNAAVEAARAGEAGKGFAVVAQEVRTLAQRAGQASREIKGLIHDSDTQVKQGVAMVQKAGGALKGIVAAVQQVNDTIAGIATAAAQQAEAAKQINTTIAQLEEMTQQNASLVEESTAASRALADQSAELRSMTGFFKVI